MGRFKGRLVAVVATMALTMPLWTGGAAQGTPAHPTRVLIVLFDQMLPQYADQFDMPNFRSLRDAGTNFKNAYLGYMASETVIAHNVIMSGQLPKHMGWVDEAYRDTDNLLGKGADPMHITGDLSLADFGTLISREGYPKLADYLHNGVPGQEVHHGRREVVRGGVRDRVVRATSPCGCRAVRPVARRSPSTRAAILGGRYRSPEGAEGPRVPDGGDDLPRPNPSCGRFFINSDSGNDYGSHGRSRPGCTPRRATASSRELTRRRRRVTSAATPGRPMRRSR